MTTQIFTKDQRNLFSPEEIKRIFESNQRYFDASLNVSGLSIPKPISFTGTSLSYEYLPGLENTLRDQWFVGNMWDTELCKNIGQYLGALHRAQGDLTKEIFLHGDFMPHNIVVQGNHIVFFDIEPPGIHKDFQYFYHNFSYVDITSFILSIFITHSFKTPWKFFKNKKSFVSAFILGYESGSGFRVNRQDLSLYLSRAIKNWAYATTQNPIKMFFKSILVRLTCFIQVNIYRALI